MDLLEYKPKDEFKYIIEKYILILLGLKDNNLTKFDPATKKLKDLISFIDECIYFVPYIDCSFGFFIKTSARYNDFDLTLANKVLRRLIKVSYNNYMGKTNKQFKYTSIYHCYASYKVAVQEAIVNHLTGKYETEQDGKIVNNTLIKLIDLLEGWSTKTYEGKRMPFGFIVDLKKESENKVNYLSFLEEEFSATLTDGITSVITIDRNGYILDYSSTVHNNVISSCEITNCLPLRFAQIIKEYIKEDSMRVGVFLLTCGDIMIARNSTVELIKRNGQWANFSYVSFINSMSRYSNTKDISVKVLEEVFATALDVSLSHSGGIIAIVNDGNKMFDDKGITILSDCDNLLLTIINEELEKNMKANHEKQASIKKRIQKRNIILSLLGKEKHFDSINRKLRSELTGLDGATIIEKDGRVVSFGAIIQNEKGSSGGGRGAAAKRLSDYGGLAIKISTDGYIEVYIDKEVKYYIK